MSILLGMKLINNLELIIKGYTQGYFLMGDEFKVLNWYSSYRRTLIPLDERFRYPKSLQRILNQEQFSISMLLSIATIYAFQMRYITSFYLKGLKEFQLSKSKACKKLIFTT